MFDVIADLPAHPLFVHLPVVLLPLAAVGLILLAAVRQWRRRFAVVTFVVLAAGAVGAVLSVLSGNAFAERVGRPEAHASAGLALAIVAAGLLVVGGGWLVWVLKHERTAGQDALGWVAAAGGVAVLVLTFVTGHSGAVAAWSGVVQASPTTAASPAPSATPTTSESGESSTEPGSDEGSTEATPSESAPTTEGTDPTGYTLAEVAQHATADSCWAAVEGNVYDLTDWINAHPGGPSHILPLCGTDATSAFTAQHEGDTRPAEELSRFLLGPLA